MSCRFVSAGTINSNGEITQDAASPSSTPVRPEPVKNPEWEAVQQELEAGRKRREDERVKAATSEERSLFDILEANKAAKQAAFEEQSKLRNQFRALDDDEVEFLEEVREKKRTEEDRVRRETEEGLKAFRERQKGETVVETEGVQGSEQWGGGEEEEEG
ncbi:hypothetical protein G7046_g10019 [Stylonectria norvegica]|nr:hypothetical protein G7046_g10019 [Stylonectria norvegica]